MKLQRLTKDNIKSLKEKKICCIGSNLSYFDDLCDAYEILEQIDCIINIESNEKVLKYRGKNLKNHRLDYLNHINFSSIVLVIIDDYYKEIFEQICAISKLKEHSTTNVFFFCSKETEIELEYRYMYKDSKLEDIIVFTSGPHKSQYVKGMDFSDNARAIFEYLLENNYNEKYELVWFVKNPEEFIYYRKLKNVLFLAYDSSTSDKNKERDKYYRVLCLAKYIFFTDAYGFARNCREDQIRVQLWHGCGFKTRLNFSRCEKRYEFTSVTSQLYADIHTEIFGLRKDQALITGCAKQDWLFNPRENWREILSIPCADKYIFWLPTYRFSDKAFNKPIDGRLSEKTGLPLIDSVLGLETMNQILFNKNIVLIIKLHPFQDEKVVYHKEYSNIIILDNNCLYEHKLEVNQLLGHADGLISDYSSAAVDYMLLDRPIAFTVDDLEEYKANRGFVFNNISKWLPGKLLFSFNDILVFINEIAKEIDSEKKKRSRLFQLMHKYSNRYSSKRIIDVLGILRNE